MERVLVALNPQNYTSRALLRTIKDVAPSLGVQLIPGAVHNAVELESAIDQLAQTPNGGFILLPDPITSSNQLEIIELALKHRPPGLHQNRFFAERGGLMSYGTDFPELYREAASYVDRILKGAKTSELPVQNPTKFEFVLNLKTAKALGLVLPEKLLALADAVIE
jgi:putative ABC transport system substrate-binding protein